MSLSTYYLEYGRHVGQLRRRRRATRSRATPLAMITMGKSTHGFLPSPWAAGAPLLSQFSQLVGLLKEQVRI